MLLILIQFCQNLGSYVFKNLKSLCVIKAVSVACFVSEWAIIQVQRASVILIDLATSAIR